MKKVKILFLFLLLSIPGNILAQRYNITNYYTEVEVKENNTYDIKEYYNIYYVENSTFQRNIPLQVGAITSSDKKVYYLPQVNNIKADNKMVHKEKSNAYELTFLEEAKDTSTTYLLTYNYNMGKDLDNNKDIVFLSITDGINADIDRLSFSIHFEKAVNFEDIVFYLDGKKVDNLVSYSAFSNTITGEVTQQIASDKKLSMRIIVEDGYFTNIQTTVSYTRFIYIIFPLSLFVITYIFYKKYGKKEIVDVDINSFDSLEMAYLYRGKIRVIDIISLILHLACEGYIEIKNYGSGDRVQYKLLKKREYDKNNAGQKIIFDGLFQNKEEIDASNINGIFYPYLEDIRQILENKKNNQKLFYTKTKKIKKLIAIVAFLLFSGLQVKLFYHFVNDYKVSILISIIISIIFYILFGRENKKTTYFLYIIMAILCGVAIYKLWYFKIDLIIYIVSYFLCFLCLYISKKIPIRTPYGVTVLKQIETFKLELITMSEEKFKNHLQDNPNYFYEMFPYAKVFGIDAWWVAKFGFLVTNPPTFYTSSEEYTHEKLEYCIDTIFSTMAVAMQTNTRLKDELLAQAPNKLL